LETPQEVQGMYEKKKFRKLHILVMQHVIEREDT